MNIGVDGSVILLCEEPKAIRSTSIEFVKPYLRPMESMTEEELEIYNRGDMTYVEEERYILAERCSNIINFLNSRYLDHNGLIPKGLALEAPEGMYDLKI